MTKHKENSDSNLIDLNTIAFKVHELGLRISAPTGIVTFGESRQDRTPHIEIDQTYAFVVCERGTEFNRHRTINLDELLYWIFEAITFTMAHDFERKHRRMCEDSRHQLFEKQVELLRVLTPEWADRRASAQSEILKQHPFRDQAISQDGA